MLTFECPDGKFPSVGALHPPAIRLERAIRDLYGFKPVGLSDTRPWLDHGVWGVRHPLGAHRRADDPPALHLPAGGRRGLHQIPVGPVHAGIIEPGHFRFTANGETVVRLEERLGYVHKGIESADAGREPRAGRRSSPGGPPATAPSPMRLPSRAPSRSALGIDVPPRAVWLRALMAELERLANHFGDIGAICNDASFSLHAMRDCGILRERMLRTAHGVLRPSADDGPHRAGRRRRTISAPIGIAATFARWSRTVRAPLSASWSSSTTTPPRCRTAPSPPAIFGPSLARAFGAGGYVGRASGRAFDARKALRYPPYDELEFEVPVLRRRRRQCPRLDPHPRGRAKPQADRADPRAAAQGRDRDRPRPSRAASERGLALVEGFRGDVLAWVRIDADGRIERCHLRDPSWFQWPLLEAAIEGNIVADFPLCNKSFNCSYSGHDL